MTERLCKAYCNSLRACGSALPLCPHCDACETAIQFWELERAIQATATVEALHTAAAPQYALKQDIASCSDCAHHAPLCGKKRRESGHVLHCDKALDHTGSCSFDEGQK